MMTLDWLGVHEEVQRLVLRARWLRWSLRNYRSGDYRWPGGRHVRLSGRLTKARPMWCERHAAEDHDAGEIF